MAEWHEHPLRYVVEGWERDFFSVGQLAQALNRSPVTIRHWEYQGVIPKARFRGPRKQRLYTRRQVEGIIQIAREERIDDLERENRPFSSTRFIERVAELFQGDMWPTHA